MLTIHEDDRDPDDAGDWRHWWVLFAPAAVFLAARALGGERLAASGPVWYLAAWWLAIVFTPAAVVVGLVAWSTRARREA